MDEFHYKNAELYCEQVPVKEIAEAVGTPTYIYSAATLLGHYSRLAEAFAALVPTICFSVKSCQNVHICRLLAERGSGFDVVSGGELYRALRAGADPAKIVFAGVAKSDREIGEALEARIGLFNIESEEELENLAAIASARGARPAAALRINPDVDPKTHAYTSTGRKETKFGVDLQTARRLFTQWHEHPAVHLCGVHLHIGSPVNAVGPYVEAIGKALELIRSLRGAGVQVDTIDIGGGFGADYGTKEAPWAADYARAIVPMLAEEHLRVFMEPGRSIAGNAGILLTRVTYTKQTPAKRFVIVDAGMNDLIRPALYGAYHFVWPAKVAPEFVPSTRRENPDLPGLQEVDVVGPVCETGDFLAKGRKIPPVRRGDLIAVFTAGAYGMVMASQYNSRPRPAEVLVEGGRWRLIRRRETYEDLLLPETQV